MRATNANQKATHMPNTITAPRWGQYCAGGALLAIALACGATGLIINVTHGLAISAAGAVLFGLADLARIACPFAAALLGWSRQIRITALIATAISVYCALTAQQANHGAHHAAQSGQAAAYAASQADAARIRAELAAITETGSASALTEAARLATKRAEDESANGGCRKRCLDARAEAERLTERAGKSARREALEQRLDGLKAQTVAPVKVEREWRGLVDGLAAILLIETLVWLSIPGIGLIAAARASAPAKPRVRKPARSTNTATAAKPAPRKTQWAAHQVATLKTMHGQGLNATAIAAQIGTTPGAVRAKAKRLGLNRNTATAAARPRIVASK